MSFIKLDNNYWSIFDYAVKDTRNLHSNCSVYLLTIKQKSKRRKIVYVGVTRQLRTRIRSHNIVSIIRKRIRENDNFQILYSDFGFIRNNRYEKELIRKYNPPYNANYPYKTYKNTNLFWEQLNN